MRVEAFLSENEHLVERMTVVLDDPPHSMLLVAAERTLLLDIEGTGPDQVVYAQSAVHHTAPDPWRDRVIAELATVL